MKRRTFLTTGAVGAVGSAVAAPALAQSMPEIRWRCASSFPKSLDALYGPLETMTKQVAEATDGKFRIQPFAAGEIVGAFQTVDAVEAGTIEMCHSPGYYFVGKDPVLPIMADIPFAMNMRQRTAWLYHGGGQKIINDYVLRKYKIHTVPFGNTGTQMGGWFRKEIKSAADLQGLKFRIAGLAGQVMAKLGAVPQQIPAGDTYTALERGTIDAAEWVGPYDDEKLAFYRVAPYYYYPGFWEGGPSGHLWVSQDKWESLPKSYQQVFNIAAQAGTVDTMALYDARNAAALKRLVAAGAQLRPFSQDILEAAYKAANEIYADLSARNPDFKAIYEHMRDFRNDAYLWWQVAEFSFDVTMLRLRQRG